MTNILARIGRHKKENQYLREALGAKTRKLSRSKEINKYYRAKIENLESIIRLRDAQLEVATFDIAKLKEALSVPAYVRSQEPLFLTEADEDSIALATAEAEDLLRQLEFENSDIEVDDPSDDSLF